MLVSALLLKVMQQLEISFYVKQKKNKKKKTHKVVRYLPNLYKKTQTHKILFLVPNAVTFVKYFQNT